MAAAAPPPAAALSTSVPASNKKTPSDFLKLVIGRPVIVKLNSGTTYHGILACLDGYMNIAMEQTEEYVNGQLKEKYGDAFIRGNNASCLTPAASSLAKTSQATEAYPLQRAAEAEDVALMRKLLESGHSVNTENDFGFTALHIAANRGCKPILELLLSWRGLEVNCRDRLEERSPLHLLARKGDVECVALLISHGALVEVTNKDGETPLFKAVDSLACIKVLVLGSRHQKEYINMKEDIFGESVLHRVAMKGHLEALKFLVEYGGAFNAQANLELKNGDGKTASDEARKAGKKEIADYLKQNEVQQAVARLKMKGIASWTTADVVRWLSLSGFEQCSTQFAARKVTGTSLLKMTAERLRDELSVKTPAQRKDILALIAAYAADDQKPAHIAATIDADELTFLPGVLGKGHFGEVKRALWRGTELEMFQKEVNILSQVKHPNVIEFIGTTVTPTSHYIVTRLMSRGTLFSLIHEHFSLLTRTPCLREKIIADVCRGMIHLHDYKPHPIIHRDLNSRNILLDENWNACVSDLGLSRFKEDSGTMTNAVGNLPWTAPEVTKGERYNEKADVYSFAMVLYEIFTAREPHDGSNMAPVRFAHMAAQKKLRPTLPGTLSAFWAGLIRRCWDDNASLRPAFSAILPEIIAQQGPDTFVATPLTTTSAPLIEVPVGTYID